MSPDVCQSPTRGSSPRSGAFELMDNDRSLIVPIDGDGAGDRRLLGGKGWGLRQMHRLGIPVPPGFALTTEAWHEHSQGGGELPPSLWEHVLDRLDALEHRTGRRFGGTPPLLVSVRSGAPVSMPGMMDTVLNVGAPTVAANPRENALRGCAP